MPQIPEEERIGSQIYIPFSKLEKRASAIGILNQPALGIALLGKDMKAMTFYLFANETNFSVFIDDCISSLAKFRREH